MDPTLITKALDLPRVVCHAICTPTSNSQRFYANLNLKGGSTLHTHLLPSSDDMDSVECAMHTQQ
jgi:hypothetical protein